MLYSTVQCQGEAKLLSYLLSTDYSYRLVQLRFQCFDTVYWDSGFGLVWVEFNAPPDTKEVISEVVFTANHLTDTDKQNSTEKYKQTQYKSEKVNNLKYSKIKLPGFSCLLQHSARNEVGLFYNAPEPTRGWGFRKSIQHVKLWVMRCWCGHLSGARSRLFAYCPADATAIQKTPSSLATFKSRVVLPFW